LTRLVNGADRFNYTFHIITGLLPNTYYMICFEAEHTYPWTGNSTTSMKTSRCQLSRTLNANETLIEIPTESITYVIESNSIIVKLYWPRELPYTDVRMDALLDRNNATLIRDLFHEVFRIKQFEFKNLLSLHEYTLQISFNYWLFDIKETNVTRTTTYPITTHAPSNPTTAPSNFNIGSTINKNMMTIWAFILLNLFFYFLFNLFCKIIFI